MKDVNVFAANYQNVSSDAGVIFENDKILHSSGIDMKTLLDHLRDPRGFEDDIDNISYYSDHQIWEKNPGKYFISTKVSIFSSQPIFYENTKEQNFWITREIHKKVSKRFI